LKRAYDAGGSGEIIEGGKLMDRRAFITMVGGSMLAAPLAAQAQPGKVYRVGILSLNARADSLPLTEALEQGLRDRGYVVGHNITLEYRSAERVMDRLPGIATELVRLKVDLILAANNPQAIAARQATTTTPIVMFLASDPVGERLIASLARPGGNITGTRSSPSRAG
jgi:putative tryptophan/tyrosine transport system substrate-binding protein